MELETGMQDYWKATVFVSRLVWQTSNVGDSRLRLWDTPYTTSKAQLFVLFFAQFSLTILVIPFYLLN